MGNEKKKGRNGSNERKEVKKRKEREGKGREGVVVIHEMFFKRDSRRNMTCVFIQEIYRTMLQCDN